MIKKIFFFISECPKFNDLRETYKLANWFDGCQEDTGLCNCPPGPQMNLPKMWYIQYDGRTGPYCNTCREPNRDPKAGRIETSVIPGILDKEEILLLLEEYEHQFVCKASK